MKLPPAFIIWSRNELVQEGKQEKIVKANFSPGGKGLLSLWFSLYCMDVANKV